MQAPPERRRVALAQAGVEISLLDWGGDGPLALLHHANGFCAATWGPVAERLREDFRVVAMDARGHGDSSRPEGESAYAWTHFGRDAAAVGRALLAESGQPRIALGLGHSFGGTSLLMAAADEPELFARLVLVDPVMPPPRVEEAAIDPTRVERGDGLIERARRRREVFPDREAARASWSEKPLFRDWDPRAFELYLQEGLRDRPDGQVELKCATEVEAAIFSQGRSFDTWEVAAKVSTPTLLLWAEHGDFPRVVFEEVAKRMGDARILDAAAGHLVPMEQPDLVAREALAFATRGDGAASPGGSPR
jgi:pimeloyl-ACP methyl ester carboxylesterase